MLWWWIHRISVTLLLLLCQKVSSMCACCVKAVWAILHGRYSQHSTALWSPHSGTLSHILKTQWLISLLVQQAWWSIFCLQVLLLGSLSIHHLGSYWQPTERCQRCDHSVADRHDHASRRVHDNNVQVQAPFHWCNSWYLDCFHCCISFCDSFCPSETELSEAVSRLYIYAAYILQSLAKLS